MTHPRRPTREAPAVGASTYTPGPWWAVQGPDGKWRIMAEGKLIAVVESSEADAWVLALAPELLRTVRSLATVAADVLLGVKDLLARAEGQTPEGLQ